MKILRWLAATAVGTVIGMGCATYPERWDEGRYRVIVAEPEEVSAHCMKRIIATGARHDNGTPVNPKEEIRACTDFKTPGKPTVFISRKWRRCARHEACHAIMREYEPWECEKKFPCLGEGK